MWKQEKKSKAPFDLIPTTTFDAVELCRQVKRIGDCKQVLDRSKYEELAGEGFKKKILRRGSDLLVCGAQLYKGNVVAVLERQTGTSLS